MTNVIELLSKQFPDMQAAYRSKSSNLPEHPRDVVVANLHDSIAVFNNPDFTVTRRGKTYKPEVNFVREQDRVKISVKYCHEMIELGNGLNTVTVEADAAVKLMQQLIKLTTDGVFDRALEEIKRRRTSAMLASRSKSKSAAA